MPDTHTARDALRRAVAAEFQRLDARDWGYDHGFCADPDADEETAAFVDAAIRIVLEAGAAHLEAWGEEGHLRLATDGDGFPLHRSPFYMPEDADTGAALLRRLAAAPTTPMRPRDLPPGEFGDLVQKRTTPTTQEASR